MSNTTTTGNTLMDAYHEMVAKKAKADSAKRSAERSTGSAATFCKHTPGPWIVRDQLHPYKDGSKAHIERGIYTQNIHPQLKDHLPVVCMSIGIGMDGEKAVSFVHIEEANARLIAAAPDLLAALNRILPFAEDNCFQYGGNADEDEDIVFARAAIAKATGGAA
jgi:hypothetical protein